jgi:hypothetical protein
MVEDVIRNQFSGTGPSKSVSIIPRKNIVHTVNWSAYSIAENKSELPIGA